MSNCIPEGIAVLIKGLPEAKAEMIAKWRDHALDVNNVNALLYFCC